MLVSVGNLVAMLSEAPASPLATSCCYWAPTGKTSRRRHRRSPAHLPRGQTTVAPDPPLATPQGRARRSRDRDGPRSGRFGHRTTHLAPRRPRPRARLQPIAQRAAMTSSPEDSASHSMIFERPSPSVVRGPSGSGRAFGQSTILNVTAAPSGRLAISVASSERRRIP